MKLSMYKIGEKSTPRNSIIVALRLLNFFLHTYLKSFETNRTGMSELSNRDEKNNTSRGTDA